MKKRPLLRLGALATGVTMALALTAPVAHADETAEDSFNALIFSKTTGFRHDSIPHGVALIEALGDEHGFQTEHTEDSSVFNDEELADYDAVIWLSTTGDVLNEDEQAAFERYVQGGGGYVGVHSASDTHYDWEWYGELVGGYFASHPPGTQDAEVMVNDNVHPSTEHLPSSWERHDEWYDFDLSPRGDVHVLAGLNEDSYADQVDPAGQMGWDHPIAWCQDYDGGRSWYTGGGHTIESYSEPEFTEHLLGGLQWAAGTAEGDCGATQWDNFQKVTLAQGPESMGEPMGLAVLPDGRAMHTTRDGQVRLWSPDTYTTEVIAEIPVYDHDEDGLQGIALDPNFEENGWVYVYYAPVIDGIPPGEAPSDGSPEDFEPYEGHNNLSRFQFTDGDSPALDLDSEQVLLEVETSRGMCCHVGGDIEFDAEGNLYLATGDDTSAFGSDGFTPIDERESRNPAFDAQRTSGNTNDLRGKLLRITPTEDGGYDIPEGNLFPPEEYDGEQTRPEIYAMGLRNPFRFSVDQENGTVYLGDYGPDAAEADPERGPQNTVSWHTLTEPANIGWPYCIGDNSAFIDYDFESNTSGEAFDCEAPVNDSPNNTGLEELPPVTPASIWYSYEESEEFPHLGVGGGAPMGGPAYQFDPELESETQWPEYYDGIPLLYEWDRDWIKQVHLGDDGGVLDITETVPDIELANPMDMEFGPDGSLYVLEYGSGWFGGSEDSALSRIDHTGSDSPVADITATPTSGSAPLEVEFSGEGSHHPGDLPLEYEWSFGDGQTSTEAAPTHTFEEAGQYTVVLTVTDGEGRTGVATTSVTAGNTAPEVSFETPQDGQFFHWGDEIPFIAGVEDAEDGSVGDGIECGDVAVTSSLGHDRHAHPWTEYDGCEGVSLTEVDGGHGHDMNIFWVLQAEYTDSGADGAPSLSGSDGVTLKPARTQAQYFTDDEGVTTEPTEDSEGGLDNVSGIGHGDWTAYDTVNLTGVEQMEFRVASEGAGGAIEARMNAPDGELLGSVDVTDTGGAQAWTDVTMDVTDPGETFTLYLVFTGEDTSVEEGLFNLNYFEAVLDGHEEQGPTTELTSPEDGAVFEEGEDVPLAAEVTDHAEAGIEQVEFLVDEEVVATATEGDYEATWEGAAAGEYAVSAVATDGNGDTGASPTATITIGEGGTEPVECSPPEVDDGYTPLWDGASLDGWTMAGPGGFEVVDDGEGCALESQGGMGLLWHEAQMESYRMKLDFFTPEESDNSGVFVGFPEPGDDPWVAVEEGYEIQIDPYGAPDGDPIHQTGAVYDVQAADSHPAEIGAWNEMEIEVDDPMIRVWVNGELVNEFENTDPARDLSSGHVGLQNHGDADQVLFRDVQVQELDPAEPVTFSEVHERVNALETDGALTHSEARRLTPQLDLTEHHLDAGRPAQAERALDRFVEVAEAAADEGAREELLELADGLRSLIDDE